MLRWFFKQKYNKMYRKLGLFPRHSLERIEQKCINKTNKVNRKTVKRVLMLFSLFVSWCSFLSFLLLCSELFFLQVFLEQRQNAKYNETQVWKLPWPSQRIKFDILVQDDKQFTSLSLVFSFGSRDKCLMKSDHDNNNWTAKKPDQTLVAGEWALMCLTCNLS